MITFYILSHILNVMFTFHYFQKLQEISKENENIQAQMNELGARFEKALSSDVS